MKRNKVKSLIVIASIFVVISLSLCYALISGEYSVDGKLYILSNVPIRFTKIENVDNSIGTSSFIGVKSIYFQDEIESGNSIEYNINFQNNEDRNIEISSIMVTDENGNSTPLSNLTSLYSNLSIQLVNLNVGGVISGNTPNNAVRLKIVNNGGDTFNRKFNIDFDWNTYISAEDATISDINTDNLENEFSFVGSTLTTKTYLSPTDSRSSSSYTFNIVNNVDYTLLLNNIFEDSNDNSNIGYTVTGISPGDTIAPGASKSVTVTFNYKSSNITNNIINSVIRFDFSHIYTISYLNIHESITEDLPTTINKGEELNITINNPYDTIKIIVRKNGSVLGEDMYSYSNSVLSVPNVSGNLVVEAKSVVTPVYDPSTGYTFTGGTNIPNSGTVLENGWTGNTYTLTFDIPDRNTPNRTYTYTVPIKNGTDKTWTDLTSSYEFIQNDFNSLRTFTPSISSTTVAPGETLTITFKIGYKSNNGTQNAAIVKGSIHMMVDGLEETIDSYITWK